ncbi:MAG: multiheme c-type cytochrome [Anaerolineae bacterium]|jgi:predicted heme/steroid binding protein
MNDRSRALVCLTGFAVLVLVLCFVAESTSLATVDYARQTGQPCATCHVRPEGGGELNALGVAYARGGYQWPVEEVGESYAPSNWAKTAKLIVGYVHLSVAVFWFGTIFYIHVVIRPQQLKTGIPQTEGIIGWVSIGTMGATGIVLTVFRYLETGSVFAGTFGTVFIIKLVQVGIMVMLAFIATAVLSPRMRTRPRPEPAGALGSPEVTLETLASQDGQDGRRALVAVGGRVYDVTDSRLWKDGAHVRQHHAGEDLTAALDRGPHGAEVMGRVQLIGELAASSGGVQPRWPAARRIFVAFTYANLALVVGILLCVSWWKWGFSWRAEPSVSGVAGIAALSDASSDCIDCHISNAFMESQVLEWERSAHARVQVACHECHRAESGDPDAMEHNGYTVSVLVTPKDCGRCHVLEAEQFAASRHSRGGDILDSLDNVLGEQVEGLAAVVLGCQQCHGATVEVLANGTLSPASWPNVGIGRINPDGSRGACSTCHTRHLFSVAVAREPASCGNCHLGPDHPQKEIYEESKHGIAFLANRGQMNLEASPWVLGHDYSAAPTCATCHMSAVPSATVNHDVGLRIAWTLRPEVSTHQEAWENRRQAMTLVCRQCHSPGFFEGFFTEYDGAVALYNEKFAMPAGQIMERLREADKLTALDFDEQIEWTYFYLWHHEGRRARHGAAMMGPDYVQWHGFFEVADRFYNEFLPEAEELLPGVTEPFLEDEHHQWRTAP